MYQFAYASNINVNTYGFSTSINNYPYELHNLQEILFDIVPG